MMARYVAVTLIVYGSSGRAVRRAGVHTRASQPGVMASNDGTTMTARERADGAAPGDGFHGIGDLYTYQQVADVLGVSERTVRRLVADGELAVVRVRKRGVRIGGTSLSAYLHRTDGEA